MASALLIDDAARAAIQQLVAFASDPANHYHPGPQAKTPGDDPRFVLKLTSYRCVFTYTRMPDKKLFRHLSVSVKKHGKWPHPSAVEMLGTLFGFTGSFESWPKGMDHDTESVILAQEIHVPPG
jgi:hypothetical protein